MKHADTASNNKSAFTEVAVAPLGAVAGNVTNDIPVQLLPAAQP